MSETATNVAPFPRMHGIECLSLRFIDKGALVGFCDLEIKAWNLILRDCKWFRKRDKEWIGLPSTSFRTREDKMVYRDLVEFSDKTAEDRFKAAALAAVKAFKTR